MSSWPLVRLGAVAETALGKMLDRGSPKGHPLVPYLRNVNVQWGQIDTSDLQSMELAETDRDRYAVLAGDLLVCEGGEIGRSAIWKGRDSYIAYQKALHRIRSSLLDARFLCYLLEHYAASGLLERFVTGSTIAHLPQRNLRMIPVPLAPLGEQRRIVEVLEEHLSRLDAAKAGLGRSEGRLFSLEASLLEREFGCGSPSVPLDALVADISAGKSFGASSPPARKDEWGIIKVSAMTWGEFRQEENKAVPAERVDQRFEIREGDLLVSRANTSDYVGASVLVGPVREKLLLSDKSLRVTPRAGVDSEWLWRALQAPSARRQMTALATGTKDSMRNISQASLRRVLLPKLGEEEQHARLRRFKEGSEAIDTLRAELTVATNRASGLRRAILTAAFSGRLTGRSSDAAQIEKELVGA